ncbi:EAL domain-containing protein [Marinibaculum pumilum]|uniref:EAL domain-containing protein n=1 Tax=Marinibaculum pumilum TaxID=1766165 RepID=A0ABV7LAV9_9PROT
MATVNPGARTKGGGSPARPARQAPDGRAERDRYAAFAFGGADLLLQASPRGQVRFAAGASEQLLGAPVTELIKLTILDLIVPEDRPFIRELVWLAGAGVRSTSVHVNLRLRPHRSSAAHGDHGGGQDGTPDSILCEVSCHAVRDRNSVHRGDLFFTLKAASARPPVHELFREAESGVFGLDGFQSVLEHRLQELHRGQTGPFRMTLIEVAGWSDLRDHVGMSQRNMFERRVGHLLRAISLNGDSAVKFSGERFGVLHGPTSAAALLEQRIGEIAATTNVSKALRVVPRSITVDRSMDYATASQTLGYTVQQFARAADRRAFAEEDDPEKAGKRTLETTSRRIQMAQSRIAAQEFKVAYQPIVRLDTGTRHHFEALIRLPDKEIAANPFEFIRFTEQTGLHCDLDMAILRTVIRKIEAVPSDQQCLPVAVNISGKSFSTSGFLEMILQELRNAGENSRYLMFEITETEPLDDLAAANARIQSIRKAGCQVCIDDFGAGEATMEYLRALDVDCAKIDGSYVRGDRADRKGQAFIGSMAALCNRLGIESVAEQVENDVTADLLRHLGVQYGQGWLWGKPEIDGDITGGSLVRNRSSKFSLANPFKARSASRPDEPDIKLPRARPKQKQKARRSALPSQLK